jgi:putative transposase
MAFQNISLATQKAFSRAYHAVGLVALIQRCYLWLKTFLADTLKTDLVIQALHSAVIRRNPDKGLIHHSDKGSQYTSYRFQAELNSHDMRASFTATGACLDNAIIERSWARLKKELIYQTHFKTRDEARLAIFEYIEVFCQRSAEALPSNREPLHSSLLYQTPHGYLPNPCHPRRSC